MMLQPYDKNSAPTEQTANELLIPFDLLSDWDLDNLPNQEWLIEGILPEKGAIGLIGAPLSRS